MKEQELQAIKERFMNTPDGYTISEDVKLIEQMEFDGIKLIVEVERLQKRLALSEKCYGIMEKCAFKLSDRMDRMELSEAKARFTLERMDNTSIFRAIVEIDRLQAALEKIAFTPAFKSQAEIEVFAEQVITSSRKALAGDSDAI